MLVILVICLHKDCIEVLCDCFRPSMGRYCQSGTNSRDKGLTASSFNGPLKKHDLFEEVKPVYCIWRVGCAGGGWIQWIKVPSAWRKLSTWKLVIMVLKSVHGNPGLTAREKHWPDKVGVRDSGVSESSWLLSTSWSVSLTRWDHNNQGRP